MKTRLLGVLLIVAGVSAAYWLYRLVHDLPYREEGVEHMVIALLAFLALTTGAALLVLGPAMFYIHRPEKKELPSTGSGRTVWDRGDSDGVIGGGRQNPRGRAG